MPIPDGMGSKMRTNCLLLLAICLAVPARGQLSPGDLAQAHADLEGLRNCDECHKLGSNNLSPLCLDCHAEIAASRQTGRGLHALPGHDRCVDCHVDHQGRDFPLIHWPEGRENFDHMAVGYPLEGAHAGLDCRKCHQAENLNEAAGGPRGKNPQRTFLGLSSRCAACHEDAHEKQLGSDCAACHQQDRWRPAPGFDHGRAAFPLSGKHTSVECVACHKGAREKPLFKPLAHGACLDCHQDPHADRFGPDCARCHDSSGWKNIRGETFDHDQTRYPLRGRHAVVECARCHVPDRPAPAFARCRDCHRDTHEAARLGRPRLDNCENCHTVEGFRPASFGLEAHQETAFPLRGAHRAVPCLACHQTASGGWAMEKPHGSCVACHEDPHRGGMEGFAGDRGCVACHDASTWRGALFDHDRTPFPLTGAHARQACAECHQPADYRHGKTDCASCHKDPHLGQFADRVLAGTDRIDCASCHVTVDWLAEKFDHETDSRFPLRGGHAHVACDRCHRPQDPAQPGLLVFKPIDIHCATCHRENPAEKGKTP